MIISYRKILTINYSASPTLFINYMQIIKEWQNFINISWKCLFLQPYSRIAYLHYIRRARIKLFKLIFRNFKIIFKGFVYLENMIDNSLYVSKDLIDFCVNPFDLERLRNLKKTECRQILPFLMRIWSRNSCFNDTQYTKYKLAVYKKIRLFEDANRIRSYLNTDFSQIYEDVIRHLSTRFLFYLK